MKIAFVSCMQVRRCLTLEDYWCLQLFFTDAISAFIGNPFRYKHMLESLLIKLSTCWQIRMPLNGQSFTLWQGHMGNLLFDLTSGEGSFDPVIPIYFFYSVSQFQIRSSFSTWTWSTTYFIETLAVVHCGTTIYCFHDFVTLPPSLMTYFRIYYRVMSHHCYLQNMESYILATVFWKHRHWSEHCTPVTLHFFIYGECLMFCSSIVGQWLINLCQIKLFKEFQTDFIITHDNWIHFN